MIAETYLKQRQRTKNNSATPKDIFSIQSKKLAQQAIVQQRSSKKLRFKSAVRNGEPSRQSTSNLKNYERFKSIAATPILKTIPNSPRTYARSKSVVQLQPPIRHASNLRGVKQIKNQKESQPTLQLRRRGQITIVTSPSPLQRHRRQIASDPSTRPNQYFANYFERRRNSQGRDLRINVDE